jgi:hypothetical protein
MDSIGKKRRRRRKVQHLKEEVHVCVGETGEIEQPGHSSQSKNPKKINCPDGANSPLFVLTDFSSNVTSLCRRPCGSRPRRKEEKKNSFD